MLKQQDIKKLFKNGKFINVILVCGILGVALIFISSITDFNPKPEEQTHSSVDEYKEEMESSIKSILSQIKGVGNVSVLLTIENSVEEVYLENNSTKTKEIQPVIRGVVVACDGGDDPIVVNRVFNAVTKALNISGAKVCITKLK